MDGTSLTHISTPAGVHPSDGYSHAITGPGRLVVLAGQMPFDPAGEIVGSDLLMEVDGLAIVP